MKKLYILLMAPLVGITLSFAQVTKEWDKTIGGNREDALITMIAASDGGILLAGTSVSSISGDKSENSRGFMDY